MNKKYLFTFLIVWIIFVLVFSADAEQYDHERQLMVEKQIKQRGVVDPQLLDAMLKVPRHLFVPENLVSLAYSDTPLPIGYGQTISQPVSYTHLSLAMAKTLPQGMRARK